MSEAIELITEIHRAVHAIGLRIASACGITQAEALVLTLLQPHGSVALDDVQKRFMHRRSTLTNVIERLESRGLARRRIDETDRRRYEIHLTRSGKQKALQVVSLFAELIAASATTRKELSAARQTLSRITDVT